VASGAAYSAGGREFEPTGHFGILCPRMDPVLRRHRGGTVLALGLVSTAIALVALSLQLTRPEVARFAVFLGVALLPVALTAIFLGWRQGAGTRSGRIDPAGRRKSWLGQVLGALALALWAATSGFVIVSWPGDQVDLMGDGSTCVVSEFYRFHHPKTRYQTTLRFDGRWVRNGQSVCWSRSGQKLEEGSYHEGKRIGEWTFWNADGSVDLARSGYYLNDVRAQEGARSADR